MKAVVLFLSMIVVGYQIVLMRIFSIAQWHHFASMIISTALLGFGFSGTILSIGRAYFVSRFVNLFRGMALLFLVSIPLATWMAQKIPFNPLLMVWHPSHAGYLFGIYLILLIPFTLGALAIGMALVRARETNEVSGTYAMNLFGSGLGAILGLMACYLPLPARISEYKSLKKALVMSNARITWTAHHPLGRVDLVQCPALRVAPALSLAYAGTIPPQLTLFVDADGGSAVNLAEWNEASMAYLEWLPTNAPYQCGFIRKALVIGSGGGTDLQQALRHGVSHVIGVEMHPSVAAFTEESLLKYGVTPDDHTRISIETAEGRSFIRSSREKYDLIQISMMDSLATSVTGIAATNESYLYTVQAFRDFLNHLNDNGILSITRWLKSPPRDNIKLLATAVEALEQEHIQSPGQHIIFVRSWATGTLLVKRTPFTQAEISKLKQWADEKVFDLDYFPGVKRKDVNRNNVMAHADYFDAAKDILSDERERFLRDHFFDLRPVSDNRPYFFHFFRWKSVPILFGGASRAWLPYVEWGYVVLVVTLIQAALASIIFIGAPLIALRTARQRIAGRSAGRKKQVFLYFVCLGMGYMFLEVVMIQKFSLFIGNPLYAAAVVIAGFLVFSGLGSGFLTSRLRKGHWTAGIIVLLSLIYIIFLPALFQMFLYTSLIMRILLSLFFIAPLALFMGVLFPLGLEKTPSELVPWAWAVNGCSSVIGAVGAAILAMDLGFQAVILLAAFFYLLAGLSLNRINL